MPNKNKDVVKAFQQVFSGRVVGSSGDTRKKQNDAYTKLLGKKKK